MVLFARPVDSNEMVLLNSLMTSGDKARCGMVLFELSLPRVIITRSWMVLF